MKIYNKNKLPLTCKRADGALLEHHHADHPHYMFPVNVDYVGDITDVLQFLKDVLDVENPTEEQARYHRQEYHALIYTDGSIAITLYECTYYMWTLKTGRLLQSSYNSYDYILNSVDLQKIRDISADLRER